MRIAAEHPLAPDVIELLQRGSELMASLYPPEGSFLLGVDELEAPHVTVLVARSDEGRALGMAALVRPHGADAGHATRDDEAELKRLFVHPDARGKGVASTLLAAIEAEAARAGLARVVLETGPEQHEAIALYESRGYERIPLFGQYVGSAYSRCYAKPLPRTPRSQ